MSFEIKESVWVLFFFWSKIHDISQVQFVTSFKSPYIWMSSSVFVFHDLEQTPPAYLFEF